MRGQKFIPLLLILAGLLAYHNSFAGPFIFDDELSIQENPTIRTLWPIWRTLLPPHNGGVTVEGRPLVNLSLAVNYALGGIDVWGYHAFNLIIHILAGLTLLGIVRRTLLQPPLRVRFSEAALPLAFATAVIWTVHPLQTESVTYVVQRAESMMGLFYLLTLYCFIRGTESRRANVWYSFSVAACVLGMATKEVMVSAPVMILLYDRMFISESFREAWQRRRPLYIGLAGTWILLGYLVISSDKFGSASATTRSLGVTWWGYLVTEPGVILHYLRLSAWPHPLCLDYGWPIANTWWSILPPAVVIAILIGASAWAWRANSVWGFVGLWFFFILAPTSSFPPTDSPAYDHRMYLPLAAVVAAGATGMYALLGRRSFTILGVVAVIFGFLTAQRNEDYRSELAIWGDAAAKRPENPRAQNNFGLSLERAGRMTEAVGQYELALRINPYLAHAHYNLGRARYAAGNIPDAIQHFEQAVRLSPGIGVFHAGLGSSLMRAGRTSEAIEQYEEALRANPDLAQTHYALGFAYVLVGKMPEAIGQYRQAVKIDPDFAEAHSDLGNALFQVGEVAEAFQHYEQALRINPNNSHVQFNFAVALSRSGNLQEAAQHFEAAARLEPNSAPAREALENARARMAQPAGTVP